MTNQPDLSHPRTPRQYLRIYLTGFAMGCADIVPGVSGGTMAFILGIYETLINAIKSFDLQAIRLALKLNVKAFLDYVPLRFLVALLLGSGTALLALSNLLHNLLENEPTYLFAFFGGLIFASILAVGLTVKWSVSSVVSMLVAGVGAFFIVGLPALENASHDPLTLFVSGMISICAMILPGISGSFVLLILGQYRYILDAVRSFNLPPIIFLGLGTIVGIIAFSRILSWLLRNYPNTTVAALVGFMLGSLRKIWMEAEAGRTIISETGELVTWQWALIVILIVGGFLLVSLLDHLQTGKNPVFSLIWRPRVRQADPIAEQAQALD